MKIERLTRVIEKEVITIREEVVDYYQVELSQEQLNMIYDMTTRIGGHPDTTHRKYSNELQELLCDHVTKYQSPIASGTLFAAPL